MSSDDLAIRVRGLSKAYRIDHAAIEPAAGEGSWRDRLRRPFRRGEPETLWALRDVSFDVPRGGVIGFVGRNGAGKSTLLKILSRITDPTHGEVEMYGRAGSLLEVGTGFHRELTGRENIFLNGAILGMTRREIASHFDEIVDFSGVEQFLDTPVKRYSSGMSVRLAFAVAAHLKPEILIIDEVLAVGDAEFQRKCLGKMSQVAREGRTVLFVSHNMGTLQSLCPRAILMEAGRAVMDGPTQEVVAAYLTKMGGESDLDRDADERPGDGSVRVLDARLLNARGQATNTVMGGEDATLELDYEAQRDDPAPISLLLNIYNDRGVVVTAAHSHLTNASLPLSGRGTLRCHVPRLPLTTGGYRVAIGVHRDGGERTADYLPSAMTFDVASSVFFPGGRSQDASSAAFLMDHRWTHENHDAPAADRVGDGDAESLLTVGAAGAVGGSGGGRG